MEKLDKYLNQIQEAYGTSTVRRSGPKKLRSSAGTIAVSLARKKDDPLYKRMIFHKHKYIEYKMHLERKYKSKSYSLARQKSAHYRRH